MKKLFLFANLVVVSVLISCNNKQIAEEPVENGFIVLSKDQFRSEKMSFGTPERVLMQEKVSFTGKIVSQIEGVIKITTPLGGLVKSIKVREGENVIVNTPLLEVGGNELIDLQQQFATSAAKISHLQAEYERAKKLYDENINTEGAFMLSESAYKSELASYSALKLKIQNIGLSISKIVEGNYYSTYTIKAPMKGQVVEINCLKGQYITPGHEIAEIISANNKELKLSFFEKNFSKISKGQHLVFSGMDAAGPEAHALIKRVGTKLNSNTNSFDCYAEIDKRNVNSYALNQLVSGVVTVSFDSVLAVPQSAIVTAGNNSFAITKEQEDEESYLLKKTKVTTGKSDKDFIELIDFPADKVILIEGTYNMSME